MSYKGKSTITSMRVAMILRVKVLKMKGPTSKLRILYQTYPLRLLLHPLPHQSKPPSQGWKGEARIPIHCTQARSQTFTRSYWTSLRNVHFLHSFDQPLYSATVLCIVKARFNGKSIKLFSITRFSAILDRTWDWKSKLVTKIFSRCPLIKFSRFFGDRCAYLI